MDSRNTLAQPPQKIPDPVETSSKQTWQIMLQQESSEYQQVAMLSLCIKTAVKKALCINMRPALILFITPSSTYRKASKSHKRQLPVSVLSLHIHTYDQTKVNSSSLLSHMDGSKVEPRLQAPVHQSSKCRGPLSPLSPNHFGVSIFALVFFKEITL